MGESSPRTIFDRKILIEVTEHHPFKGINGWVNGSLFVGYVLTINIQTCMTRDSDSDSSPTRVTFLETVTPPRVIDKIKNVLTT